MPTMSNLWALDTETVNRSGRGEACLVVKMSPDGPRVLLLPTGWPEIWSFLCDNPKPARYVCWNMDFDVRALIHPAYWPDSVLEKLAIFGHAHWRRWRLDYIRDKRLIISDGERRVEIFDLAQFYGLSLREASILYLPRTMQKLEVPESWYGEMDCALLDPARRELVVKYACRDVEATQALLDKLLTACERVNLEPRRLASCATLARLKWRDVFERERRGPQVNRIFERGFFGGRIETRVLGRIGPCRAYDLHSAYPSVLRGLVSSCGGVHYWGRDWRESDAAYGVYRIRAEVPRDWTWGPLAVRKATGEVFYPVGEIETYCCRPALSYLKKWRIPYQVHWGCEIERTDDRPVFGGVEELYRLRKDSTASMAAKLILNSAYGILCEMQDRRRPYDLGRPVGAFRISSSCHRGRYQNLAMAAAITEEIRMRVWEVLHMAGPRAYFAATDGVLLDARVSLPTGPNLGEWGDPAEYTSAVVLGPGRYALYRADKIIVSRLRGFPGGKKIWAAISKCRKSIFRVPCREAASLFRWATALNISANVLEVALRNLRIFDDRRWWPSQFRKICDAWKYCIESLPLILVGKSCKIPVRKSENRGTEKCLKKSRPKRKKQFSQI